DGEGEHVLVRILKNGCNTRFVADALEQAQAALARAKTQASLAQSEANRTDKLVHMTTSINHGYRGAAASIAGLQTGLAI
ncbi:hypothetical protein ACTXQV_72490, partial [Klebsiella pneumoniae]